MRGKIAFVLGAAAGYVLGSRAGRERYEQIKRGAQHLWNTDPVQNGVTVVKDAVDERTDDLKAFAVRVGSDVFSNLTQSGKRSHPLSSKSDAEGSSTSKAKSTGSKSSGGGSRSSAAKSGSAKSGSTKSSSAKSGSAKSSTSKSAQPKGKAKSGGSKADS